MADRKLCYISPRLRIEYEADKAGIRHIAVSDDIRDVLYEVARLRAAPYALSIAPEQTGNYRASFYIEQVTTGISPEAIGRPPMRRAGTRLVNKSEYAAAIEFGSKFNAAQHVLGETLRHLRVA